MVQRKATTVLSTGTKINLLLLSRKTHLFKNGYKWGFSKIINAVIRNKKMKISSKGQKNYQNFLPDTLVEGLKETTYLA